MWTNRHSKVNRHVLATFSCKRPKNGRLGGTEASCSEYISVILDILRQFIQSSTFEYTFNYRCSMGNCNAESYSGPHSTVCAICSVDNADLSINDTTKNEVRWDAERWLSKYVNNAIHATGAVVDRLTGECHARMFAVLSLISCICFKRSIIFIIQHTSCLALDEKFNLPSRPLVR